MKRVEFSLRAREDIAEISDHIAASNPARARSFVEELLAAGELRGQFPLSGRRRPDLGDHLFTFPYGRYLIVYSTEPDRVLIRRILHGSRNLDAVLRDEA